MLLELLALGKSRVARRNYKTGMTPAAQFGIDGGYHHMNISNSAIGDPGFCPVDHPLIGGFFIYRTGSDCRDIGTGVGF